jgi:signal transduction histidine kinase
MISILIAALVAILAAAIYAAKRIAGLAAENRRLQKQAQGVMQMKREFISHVSHELKAPLASVQETTQLLLERIPGPLTDKQRRLLDLNLQSGKRLAGMIGDLLELSTLEAGAVEYDIQPYDISPFVLSFVEEFQARNAGMPIHAEAPSAPVMVSCDPGLIAELLEKLLDNALYVSSRGIGIQVELKRLRKLPERLPASVLKKIDRRAFRHGFVLASVADSGPGIDDSQKENIFEIFHQLRYGPQHPGVSLGLGLSIARALAEVHHGVIWVEDNPEGGSVFKVLFPGVAEQQAVFRQAS